MRSLHLWRMPEMVAPRALVFRPLVKGNEDSGNEIVFRAVWKGYLHAQWNHKNKDLSVDFFGMRNPSRYPLVPSTSFPGFLILTRPSPLPPSPLGRARKWGGKMRYPGNEVVLPSHLFVKAGSSRQRPLFISGFQCHAIQNRSKSKSKQFNRYTPESGKRKKVNLQSTSPRFRSQQFLLTKYAERFFTQIYRDLYGDNMPKPIRIGSDMAAWDQQKHISLSFAIKALIYLSRNSITLK